jgi:hypothetical protein
MTAADEVRGILGPELPEVKVLRLQPGDILVAKVDDRVSQERAVSLRETLQTAFPGYEVVVVSGFDLEVARALDIDGIVAE